MADKGKIEQTIYRAIDEVNMQMSKDKRLEKAPETVLYSKSGGLDSMGIVNFIVLVEELLEEDFGVTVNLADEAAMARENNPYRTVNTLVDYVASLV